MKATAFEPFAANPESASVPKKDFQLCARGVGKGEEMAGKGLLAETGLELARYAEPKGPVFK